MTTISTDTTSRRALWSGRIISGLMVAFLLMDASMKLVPLQPVIDTMQPLGWPIDAGLWRILGAIQIAATLLYIYPRSSVLGAILLTGYLGGAIATHLRVGSPLLTHVLFGLYVGLALWLGLWLRDPRIRALLR